MSKLILAIMLLISPLINQSSPQPKYQNEAIFTAYAYCPCTYCCGKSNGITATGTIATAGRTIAVDPKIIPLGSTVIINGREYIAEDTGGGIRGYKVDIFFSSHEEALRFGKQKLKVKWLSEEKNEKIMQAIAELKADK